MKGNFFHLLLFVLLTGVSSCVSLDKNRIMMPGVDPFLGPLVAVQISDWHVGQQPASDLGAAKWAESFDPKVLFLTGDILDEGGSLKALDASLGHWDFIPLKFAIMGNNEWKFPRGLPGLRELFKKHGITLLINQSTQFPWGRGWIRVVGLDSLSGSEPPPSLDLQNRKFDFTFVLIHEPILFTQHLEGRLDPKTLVLGGHTHGGQITLFGLPLKLPSGSGNYVQGLYHKDQVPFYVNRGLGNNPGLDFRFFANPEVLLIRVQ